MDFSPVMPAEGGHDDDDDDDYYYYLTSGSYNDN